MAKTIKTITDQNKIDEVLDRGIIKSILPTKEEFRSLLLSGKRIKIYVGFDATADTLHLSHAKNIMMLEDFRRLGHEVVLLFGDFTARIGDPSDQTGTRKILTKKDVLKNVKSWTQQIKNLTDFNNKTNPTKILFNSKWLAKLTMEEVLDLASNITVQQMIERDMFQKRLKDGKHIFLHEFMYPLMQGYDSVAMNVDVELCGTDQTFNALVGRTLLRKLKNKDKFVITVNLMENPKTGDLMSKSRGTGVFLNTTPEEMFGGVMAQPDEMIKILLINCTRLPLAEIDEIVKLNPIEAKKRTSYEIVKVVHNEKQAKIALDFFERTFQKKEIPEDILEIKSKSGVELSEILLKENLIKSKSEFRRLVEEGAVHNLDKKENITDYKFILIENITLKIGKKRFIKIVI